MATPCQACAVCAFGAFRLVVFYIWIISFAVLIVLGFSKLGTNVGPEQHDVCGTGQLHIYT